MKELTKKQEKKANLISAESFNCRDYDVLTSQCKIQDNDFIWKESMQNFVPAPLLCQGMLVGDHLVIRGK